MNFSPSFVKEMKGKHPDPVVSSNEYNKKTNVIIVCPITSGGNTFSGYVLLNYYKTFGKVNATQIHSFDTDRIINTEFIERLRDEEFLIVKQVLDYALEVNF